MHVLSQKNHLFRSTQRTEILSSEDFSNLPNFAFILEHTISQKETKVLPSFPKPLDLPYAMASAQAY